MPVPKYANMNVGRRSYANTVDGGPVVVKPGLHSDAEVGLACC